MTKVPGNITGIIRKNLVASSTDSQRSFSFGDARYRDMPTVGAEEDVYAEVLKDLEAQIQEDSNTSNAGEELVYAGVMSQVLSSLEAHGIDREYLVTLATSTAAFALHFFPDHFTRPFSPIHASIFYFLDDDSKLRCALAAPRGYGKTTIMDIAFILRRALFGYDNYIVLVSATATLAEEQLRNLRIELETNEHLKAMFGDLKGTIWTSDSLLLANGCFIRARGAGQQVRGLKFRQYRPSLIICDDLESKEDVQNEDLRVKLKKWFKADLMRAGAQTGTACKVIIIGTILHQDSLLENLLGNGNWSTARLEAFDDDFNPVDESFLNREQIEKIYNDFLEDGLLDELYMEYRNMPIATETRLFPTRFQGYYPGDDVYNMVQRGLANRTLISFVICDPAKTAKFMSDYSALIGLAIDLSAGLVYVHKARRYRTSPDQLIIHGFEMCDEMNTNKLFFEVTGLNDWALTVIRTVMLNHVMAGHDKLYDVEEIHNTTKSKEDRIACLAPLYRTHMIMHNKAETKDLEDELIMFPKARNDDLSDDLANLIPILSKTNGWEYKSIDELVEQWRLQNSTTAPKHYATGRLNQSEFRAI